ncbi:MAG: pro-sigmaK processing inhibitor BofA family protein [Defluviitaleaceae bacterium]|nr:pro-sigmaK processing inhibitor BofA family protein [Defluviitaleaceae bacterium]
MGSHNVIMLMIGACLILILFLLFSNPLKALVRVVANGGLGIIGLAAANTLLAPLGVFVGINPVTAAIIGFLGLPGFVALYVAGFIFRV